MINFIRFYLRENGHMAKEKVPWSAYDNLRAESIYGKLPIKPKGIHCKKYKNIKRAMLGRSFLSDEL